MRLNMTLKKLLIAITVFIGLGGCSTMNIESYQDVKPALALKDHLTGTHKAYGQFIDRFGTMRRQFTVDITGTWSETDQALTLNEKFLYLDGEKDEREWVFTKQDTHTYSGVANDIDETVTAKVYGNAFNMKYTYPLKMDSGTMNVTFDDWIWLQPQDGVLINRTIVSKWGIKLGELLITFVPKN